MNECEAAFNNIKEYLSAPPLLTWPKGDETLQLYLVTTNQTVGAVLIKDDVGIQKPVFYVSHTLKGVETRYPNIEKLALGLIIAARKLRHYFQGRTIETAIKSQALTNFMVECSFKIPMEDVIDDHIDKTPKLWIFFVDGSVAQENYGGGMILTNPSGFKDRQAVRFTFKVTNNEAGYEAMICGIKLARSLEVTHLQAYSDSQLVVKHFSGEYDQKEKRLKAYAMEVRILVTEFDVFEIMGIIRVNNGCADALSRLATTDKGEKLDDANPQLFGE
ncbi:hypothetical protein AgCh_001613 [Apium graveolens]